jgi:hypothetical protein
MSLHEPSRPPAGIPLQALVAELRSSCRAIARLQGGDPHYGEELALFIEAARAQGLFLQAPPDELSRVPDEEGNEHQVWYQPSSKRYLKATWPDFFGMLVVHRPDEEPKASPIDYLERWLLHNEIFGDDVRFLGALVSDAGLRLLIQQPAIAGIPATDEQIRCFFTSSGWLRFVIDGHAAFFDPARGVVISDTHRGNIILMDDGLLAPIDLRVQALSGSLLDTVVKLCGHASDSAS